MTSGREAGEPSGVLRSLPRRARAPHVADTAPQMKIRRVPRPKVSTLRVLARLFRWLVALMRFGLLSTIDRLRGRETARSRGVRTRQIFEYVGGTGPKIGQQLAIRVDFLPFDVCRELEKLLDDVPPFPVHRALERIEAAIGGPMAQTFSDFDPNPIGSASVACVYRATLLDGAEVAIKVRRPRIAEEFAADLRVVDWVTQAAEALALVRPAFFRNLRRELAQMLMDELDFVKEANFQILFRRLARRDGLRWVTSPRVYGQWTAPDVLITQFVDGYPCARVLAAAETQDAAALAVLASVDIDPRVLGRRLLHMSHWSRMESPFFHADPHPGNLIIRPGNQIVVLDFGCCGISSRRAAEQWMEMCRRFIADDIAGGTAMMLAMMAPLPNVDLDALRARGEQVGWESHLRNASKDAAWWERTTAFMWMRFIELSRDFALPVNADMLQMTRATLLYDTLACRLDSNINGNTAYARWLHAAAKRARRRACRGTRNRDRVRRLQEKGLDLVETVQKGAFWISHVSRDVPTSLIGQVGKAAFVFSAFLRVLLAGVGVLGVVLTWMLLRAWLASSPDETMSHMLRAVTHPVVLGVVLLGTIWYGWRVRRRLTDVDR